MRRNARSRSPVPGRRMVVTMMMMWAVAGCSYDETLRPELRTRSSDAVRAVADPGALGKSMVTQWSTLSDESLWAHVAAAGYLADVGLRAPGARSGMDKGRVLVNGVQRSGGRRAVVGIGDVQILSADTLLPIVQVRLGSRQALSALRASPYVEYVEPGAFADVNGRRAFGWNDVEFGCSVSGYAGPLNYYVYPGDILPWNYKAMRIDSIWNRTGGAGVTIGIVDTGVDENVSELNYYFTSGMSGGRTFWKDATNPNLATSNPWHDTCGHGTRMSSVIGAPRNGNGMLGVAWKASLYMVRVDDDVILTEVEATRLGIRRAATAAKIVATAFGTYAHYSSIAQELSYWHAQDRLIVAAAGTTSCWDPWHTVTFPGTLETVTTVTGFDEKGGLACSVSRGWQVDFAAFTNQPAQGLSALGPTLAGFHGSSGAVGVFSGMAGLYLSLFPNASRANILASFSVAASPMGGRSPLWGFGVPDGLCVVKEMCTGWIEGPNLIQQSGRYTWTAYQRASPGPIAYSWGPNETTQSITRDIVVYPGMPEYSFTLKVKIRDTPKDRSRVDTRLVLVRYPYGCPTCF